MISLCSKTEEYIKEHNLIEKGDKVICALSGGADSVAMLHLLNSLKEKIGFEIYAAHLNHMIRGEEAKRDEDFSSIMCKSLGVKCFVASMDVAQYAREHSMSIEQAGRACRYDFFDELKSEIGANKIATAHNKNDNAETVLMHILRGSGTSGLKGIINNREGIIRPLLDVYRKEIEEYLAEINIDYVTDSTNCLDIYTRNSVRIKLIPFLQSEFNPNIVNNLCVLAGNAMMDNEFLQECTDNSIKQYVRDLGDKVEIEISDLLSLSDAILSRVIIKMAQMVDKEGNIESKHIKSVVKLAQMGQTGKMVNLPDEIIAGISYDKLYIEKNMQKLGDFEYIIPVGESIYVKEITAKVISCVIKTKDFEKGKDRTLLPLCGEIIIRNRRDGDRVTIGGHTKKLKDLFIDLKIPRSQRDIIPIVEIEGNIAWIAGIRVTDQFKVVDSEYAQCVMIEKDGGELDA